MKKIMLSFSLIALAALFANAQITVGIKGGMNVSNWTGADATSTNFRGKAAKLGLNIGAQVALPIHKNFTIQPEAVYSMEGVKVDGGHYELDYVNVPVLAVYRFPNSRFSIGSGPQVGFLINAQAKATNAFAVDIKDSLQKLDYAWAVNLAYMTRFKLGINMRYNIGLNTIDKESNGMAKQKINNSVFQLGVFWNLKPVGKMGMKEKRKRKKK